MSILNALGKGMMPNFGMRGSRSSPFTNVSEDMLNTAATGAAMRENISDKFSSDLSAFDQGTAALKDIFGEEEPSIEDLISEETVLEEALDDDIVDYSMNDSALSNIASDAAGSALTGIFSPGGLLGKLITANMGMNYASNFGNDYVKDVVDMVDPEGDIRTVPSEEEEAFDFFGLMDFYRDAAGDDGKISMVPNFMGTSESPYIGYEDGGRVGLNTGGMPNRLSYGYTPFMDAQQGLNYYQQFAAPNYPVQQAVPMPSVPGEGEDRGQSSAVPPEGFGSMQDGTVKDLTLGNQLGDNIIKPGGGGGYYDFQGGYKGFSGRDDIDPDQTTMGFNDEGKLVYTGFKSNIDPTKLYGGIKVGDEVPFVSPALGALAYGTKAVNDFFGGLFAKKDKDVQDEIDTYNKQKVDELNAKKAKEQKALDEKNAKIAEEKKKADELAAKNREEAARRTAEEQKAQDMADARARRQADSTKASRQKRVDDAKRALKDRVQRFNSNPSNQRKGLAMTASGDTYSTKSYSQKQRDRNRQNNRGVGRQASAGDRGRAAAGKTGGGFCFDPSTLVQMFDGSEKRIKDIKLGDKTKGGEVTGVFQFKASDEIHDYKGVTVAGSHYVKEGGKFIMVQDSPISVKIDKIPVVHSLDTTGRRIFIKDIEFADYNGDGIAKGFLANAGVDLTGFDQEVLRQVEHRLI